MKFELIPNGLSCCGSYLPQADIMVVLNQTGGEEVTTALNAGMGETGHGPLVSSVFVAAMILPEHSDLPGLTDSKKLNEGRRDMLAQMIKGRVVARGIAFVDPDEILQPNILHTAMAAMKYAIEGLSVVSDKVWIDGNRVPRDLSVPAEAVVRGDSKIIEISAASVLAKTTRDVETYELARRYPQYGFNRHKGYGMAQHLAALKQYGILPERRRDFAPVKTLSAQGNLLEE